MPPAINPSVVLTNAPSLAPAQAAASSVIRHRFIAAALVAAFVLALPASRRYESMIYDAELVAFGLAHYVLSLIYARNQVKLLARNNQSWVPSLVVALFCAVFITAGAWTGSMSSALLIYFGIHHLFNEAHMSTIATNANGRAFRLSGAVFHGFLYTALVVHDREWITVLKKPIIGGLLASALFFVGALWLEQRQRSFGTLLRSCAFEWSALAFALVVAGFELHVRWTDIVLFHFVYWLLYPTVKLKTQGTRAMHRYLIANVALVLGFGVVLIGLPRGLILDLFNIGSFFHIATSFALSRAQPLWITRWFWPVVARAN